MVNRRNLLRAGLGAGIGAGVSALYPWQDSIAQSATPLNIDQLIAAAKAEGEVVFYLSATEPIAKALADAFSAKYGIRTAFVRLSPAPMVQRFTAESEGGNPATDLVWIGTSPAFNLAFGREAVKRGWIESISRAGLPVLQGGAFPTRFMRENSVVVELGMWVIGYNTDRIKAAEIPKNWTQTLDAKFRGQILIPDPLVSNAYIGFWGLLYETYGEEFFARLRDLKPRFVPSAVPGTQALAAGEAILALPTVTALTSSLKEKGAPVDRFIPDVTTSTESEIFLVARNRSKHPNAGRLLANYMMSEEGNRVINGVSGGIVSIYDTRSMPSGYKSPRENIDNPTIKRLLGI